MVLILHIHQPSLSQLNGGVPHLRPVHKGRKPTKHRIHSHRLVLPHCLEFVTGIAVKRHREELLVDGAEELEEVVDVVLAKEERGVGMWELE